MERPKITDFIKETIANSSIELMYLKDYIKELETYTDKQEEAISVTRCCKSDSELLRDKKETTTLDAFLAGYKKRAEMSGLKYDEVSELHAKTLYKCWNSFDLNP